MLPDSTINDSSDVFIHPENGAITDKDYKKLEINGLKKSVIEGRVIQVRMILDNRNKHLPSDPGWENPVGVDLSDTCEKSTKLTKNKELYKTNINKLDMYGRTIFIYACLNKNEHCCLVLIKMLLQSNRFLSMHTIPNFSKHFVNVNIQDKCGRNKCGDTILAYAARYCSIHIVKMIINVVKKSRLDLFDSNCISFNPLTIAIKNYRYLSALEILNCDNVNINQRDDIIHFSCIQWCQYSQYTLRNTKKRVSTKMDQIQLSKPVYERLISKLITMNDSQKRSTNWIDICRPSSADFINYKSKNELEDNLLHEKYVDRMAQIDLINFLKSDKITTRSAIRPLIELYNQQHFDYLLPTEESVNVRRFSRTSSKKRVSFNEKTMLNILKQFKFNSQKDSQNKRK
ncbi:hypothetical protein A3Q56_05873 [Intoshia linei]|uniref:Uncharacterized protein n=1 Tax=Intoshia linei TaxID=1819745 RepID=A0A177AYA3_9BILA|nr:hypothetical protein A3Q56_05873 [Intoshia linei]